MKNLIRFYYYIYSKLKGRLFLLRSKIIASQFESVGRGSSIGALDSLIGSQYIKVGVNSHITDHCILTAWDKLYLKTPAGTFKQTFRPSIIIGDSVNIGPYSHISSTNSIRIGNGVLTGRWVSILDNNHGAYSLNNKIDGIENLSTMTLEEMLIIPPVYRPITSDVVL